MTRGLSTRQRGRGERGAAALEFALVVPILMMLLIGMVTTGLVYSDHLGVTNAVREGARYGAAADATVGATWASSVQTRVKDVYFNASGTAPTDDQICVQLVQPGGGVVASDTGSACGTAPPRPTGMAPGSCAVLVWMSKPARIELAVAPDLNLTLNGESAAYYGRTVGTTCTAD